MNQTKALAERISRHFQNPAHRSYPLLLTTERIEEELRKIRDNKEAFWILEEKEGEARGICAFFVDAEAKYLQTVFFLSFDRDPEFFRHSLDELIEKYPAFTIHVGTEAENTLLVNALKQKHRTICSLKEGETITAYIFIQCSPTEGLCEISANNARLRPQPNVPGVFFGFLYSV